MVGSSDLCDYRLAASIREDFKVQGKPSNHLAQDFTIIFLSKSVVLGRPMAGIARQWVYKLLSGGIK